MREVSRALRGLADLRGRPLNDREVSRYLVMFAGHREPQLLDAIRSAARDTRRFPSPHEILNRIPAPRDRTGGDFDDPPPPSAEERAAVRCQAEAFLSRFGMTPAGTVRHG